MAEDDLTPKQRRARINARIEELADELKRLVKEAQVYEPGELVMIPTGREPVVMRIIGATEDYGTYKVEVLGETGEDGKPRVTTQEARYFYEYAPGTDG